MEKTQLLTPVDLLPKDTQLDPVVVSVVKADLPPLELHRDTSHPCQVSPELRDARITGDYYAISDSADGQHLSKTAPSATQTVPASPLPSPYSCRAPSCSIISTHQMPPQITAIHVRYPLPALPHADAGPLSIRRAMTSGDAFTSTSTV